MTIKEFSILCECNPQTLRYYDKIGLLKPDEVDEWTGYRYYKENQALDFVKIKNLQEAEFSIEEIKELLRKNDDDIYCAFEKKIQEQLIKLEQMKKIQSTYLSEKHNMEKTIRDIQEKLLESAKKYDPEDEFGISEESYKKIIDSANQHFESSIKNSDLQKTDFSDDESKEHDATASEEKYHSPLENVAYIIQVEKHCWKKTKEALEVVPKLEDGEYLFHFEVEKSRLSNMAFCNVILGHVLDENKGKRLTLGCNCVEAEDGQNHFWLLRAK